MSVVMMMITFVTFQVEGTLDNVFKTMFRLESNDLR